MNIHKYQNKIFFIFLIFFLVIPTITEAKVTLSIFPEKFDLEVSRGEILKDKIRISNSSDTPLTININLKNFSAGDETGGMVFKEEAADISYNPSQWIKFEKESFILEPGESKEIKFTLNVPANAEPGGHYAAAFFQTEISPETAQARIMPTLAVLFLLKIKGAEEKYPALDKQIELVEFNVPRFIEAGPVNLSFRVKNNDPIHIKAGGRLVIYNLFNRVKEEIKIEEQTILPGKIRFFEVKTSDKKKFDKFFIGPYRVELVLASQTWREKIGNDRQLVEEINFFAFPWKTFLIFISVLFLIIILRYFLRKNKKSQLTKSN